MVERKLFLQIKSINIVYPNRENMIVVPITKRMETITSIQVCLISQMNFYYKKNSVKNAFFANLKHQYRVSQCREHDYCDNNKKNKDYYVHPSLFHFTNEL